MNLDPTLNRRAVESGELLTVEALAKAHPESEKAFQARVVALAKLRGWWTFHPYDSRRSEPGWPDCAFIRDRFMLRELKTQRGRLTVHQATVLMYLQAAGVDAKVWRPSDWPEIERVLQ